MICFRMMCLVLSAVAMVGCGLEPASAPRLHIEVEDLREFPRKNVRLTHNQLFLWPENVTTDQISKVMALSQKIEELDLEAIPLNRRIAELHAKVEPIEREIRTKTQLFNGTQYQLRKKQNELHQLNESLRTVHEAHIHETSVSEQSQLLAAQVAKLENELLSLQLNLGTIQSELDLLTQNPERLEKVSLEAVQSLNQEKGAVYVTEVSQVVTWFEPPPTSIVFRFEENHSIFVSVSNWTLDPMEGPRNFSTAPENGGKPTIENVTYQERGGIFNFDVKVYDDFAQSQLRETYSFKIARVKYHSTDHRVYFSGEFNRIRKDSAGVEQVRHGVAKLIDNSN